MQQMYELLSLSLYYQKCEMYTAQYQNYALFFIHLNVIYAMQIVMEHEKCVCTSD